jgi:Spy/CpxP family protein refolding chaperone
MEKTRISTVLCALLFTQGVLAVCPRSALAQGQNERQGDVEGGPVASVEDQMKNLSAQLNLTEEQRAQIKPILEDERQQLLMKDDSLSREDRITNKQRIRERAGSKIRDLLNDEQKTKFDQLEKERRARMNSRKENSGGESPK